MVIVKKFGGEFWLFCDLKKLGLKNKIKFGRLV
jgi:hypothetical protein